MKYIFYRITILSICIVGLFSSCKIRQPNMAKIDSNNVADSIIKASLLNNKCEQINSIIPSDKTGADFVVLLYHGYDCDKCIMTGFSLIKLIEKKYPKVFAIGIMANTSVQQINYNYKKYIYSDNNDIIRNELRYAPTPLLLHIDSSYIIKDALYLGNNNKKQQDLFIYKCMQFK